MYSVCIGMQVPHVISLISRPLDATSVATNIGAIPNKLIIFILDSIFTSFEFF